MFSALVQILTHLWLSVSFVWLSLTVVESNGAHIMAGNLMNLVMNALNNK